MFRADCAPAAQIDTCDQSLALVVSLMQRDLCVDAPCCLACNGQSETGTLDLLVCQAVDGLEGLVTLVRLDPGAAIDDVAPRTIGERGDAQRDLRCSRPHSSRLPANGCSRCSSSMRRIRARSRSLTGRGR